MVKSCAVVNCTQRYQKGISFHQFPGDKALLKRWLTVMKQQNWTPSKFSLICSKHFTEDCYEKNGWSSQRKLKPTAVPSIFNFSDTSDMKKKLRPRSQTQIQSVNKSEKNSAEDSNDNQVVESRPNKKGKIKSPKKSNPPIKCPSTSRQTSKSEIKILQENNKLLKKKLSNLEALVKYLKEKSLTIEPVSKGSKKRRNR